MRQRKDEEFARKTFDAFLRDRKEAPIWRPGNEPPDYVLSLGVRSYAIEVTQIMEHFDVGGKVRSARAIDSFLAEAVTNIERRALAGGILEGNYILSVKAVEDSGAIRERVAESALRYIAATRSLRTADLVRLRTRPGKSWSIRKISSHAKGVFCIQHSKTNLDEKNPASVASLLRTPLNGKSRRLASVELPSVLLLLDAYVYLRGRLGRLLYVSSTLHRFTLSPELPVTSAYRSCPRGAGGGAQAFARGEIQEKRVPKLSDKVVLDSNTMTYLNEAFDRDYDPASDASGLREERVALMRIHLHLDCIPWIVPAIEVEYQRIKRQAALRSHTELAYVYLHEATECLDPAAIDARVAELSMRHFGVDDCRIVAEAEAIGGDVLLTCDRLLVQRLTPVAKIALCRPSEYWHQLGVPRGRKPPSDIRGQISNRWWDW